MGSSARPRRNLGGEMGILGPRHGPGAKQAQKRGFGVTGASRAQNKVGKMDLGRKMGDLGLIPRPRRRTRSEPGIWGQTRDPGAERAQKGPVWVKRAPPAQNRLRNRGFGLITRPPRGLGRERGILGSARPRAPPVLTPLAHLFLPLILGAISSF